MHQKIQAALEENDPVEFLGAVMALFPYSHPQDFAGLNAEGKLAVCCYCFALDMFSGGYLIVLDRYPVEWVKEMLKSLTCIGAEPYATEFAEIVRIEEKHRLRRDFKVDWERYEAYLAQHPSFELEAVRGCERVVEVVAECLRAYVTKHPSSFA
jgi:hypothetical protein